MIKIHFSDLEGNEIAEITVEEDKIIEIKGDLSELLDEITLEHPTILRDKEVDDSILTFEEEAPVEESLQYVRALSYNLPDEYIISSVEGLDKEMEAERQRLQELVAELPLDEEIPEPKERDKLMAEDDIQMILKDLASGEIELGELDMYGAGTVEYFTELLKIAGEGDPQEQAETALSLFEEKEEDNLIEEEPIVFYEN